MKKHKYCYPLFCIIIKLILNMRAFRPWICCSLTLKSLHRTHFTSVQKKKKKSHTFPYHISHASGTFLHPVNWSTIKFLQGRLSVGQQLVWEMTVKQNLLPVTGQSQPRDTHRHLVWNERTINK